ncbi:hypothetical protein [Acinetobacter rudis]|uniref:Lipoprotein n=1 Tax=Acinetobacter rudis TaxID=632955 RepID=A0AAW8J8J0_9GAMM|nr:hypothetical protein [Acinetobacter rudis]MDQ8934885.1 hypothetical protein [Acinetobacter rudis]MDQ8953094.1 hypothetical protein [Acinetobacter rudis]MDQ9017286.1 hypothetical protein [Acinetobacter rudis]
MTFKISLGPTLLAILSIALLGCEKSEQQQKNQEPAKSIVASTVVEDAATSSSPLPSSAVPVVSAQAPEILCDKVKVNQWVGFDESAKDAQCKKVESYNIAEYRCAVEKKAFGADFDAIHLLSKDQSIFIYSSMEKCNQAKEIWQSNSPE